MAARGALPRVSRGYPPRCASEPATGAAARARSGDHRATRALPKPWCRDPRPRSAPPGRRSAETTAWPSLARHTGAAGEGRRSQYRLARHEGIGAASSSTRVGARPAVECVVSGPAFQGIAAVLPERGVVTVAADQAVLTLP